MKELQLRFRGCVNVYLQGKGALLPLLNHQENSVNYYLGSPASKIRVLDFRKEPVNAARLAITGKNGFKFSDVFNQPALVEIRESESNEVEIVINECREKGDFLTLWLGVLHEDKMSVHKIKWEVLRPVSESQTAFAALIDYPS